MAFRARFPPLDGNSEPASEIWAEQFFRIEVHLGAESATDIRCDDPQLMLGNTDRVGDPAAVHVRHLALDIERQGAVDIRFGEKRACFHAGRDQAIIGNAKLDDLIGLTRGFLVVAATDLVDRRYIVRHVVVQLRSAVEDSNFFVGNRCKGFVVDFDEVDGVIGHGLRFRHHQRDALADEANAVDGNDGPVRHLGPGHDPVGNDRADLSREVGA
jgi:hypothetical protein